MSELIGVAVAAVVLVVVGGVATAALVAITSLRPAQLQGDRSEPAPSQRLVALTDEPQRWYRPTLLVAVSALVLESALVVGYATAELGASLGVLVAGINLMVVFVVVVAVPHTVAGRDPERVAVALARVVQALAGFAPIRWAAAGLFALGGVLTPGGRRHGAGAVSEQELLALADEAVEREVLEEDERELIASIIGFGDTVVREVMVPRPDMISVDANFRVDDVMEVAILNGLSRLPATDEGIDDVVGLVYAKDLMRAERDGEGDTLVRALLRPARFVPETSRISALLRQMQAEQFHMAIVVDEYGGTAGVVTLEDLIEELVGEIVDEYDREEPMTEPLGGGRARVNARVNVDELDDLFGARLPHGDWDSVGGLLFHLLGHVPERGEWAECEGWLLVADRVQGRRILSVLVEPASCALDHPARVDLVHERGAQSERDHR